MKKVHRRFNWFFIKNKKRRNIAKQLHWDLLTLLDIGMINEERYKNVFSSLVGTVRRGEPIHEDAVKLGKAMEKINNIRKNKSLAIMYVKQNNILGEWCRKIIKGEINILSKGM